MPSRAKPLWFLTIALLVGAPVLNIVYWWQVLISGVLPHDGDSVAPLMFAGVLVALLSAPPVLAVTWFCLRRYNPRTTLLAWRGDRLFRTLSASLVFGVPAFGLAVGLVQTLFGAYPWSESLLATLALPAIAWLLAMRAAVIAQLGSAGDTVSA